MRLQKKKQRQRKIIILSYITLLSCIITGYAAFGTNINLNVTGNIKIDYKKVNFKTELLSNTDFENGLENWEQEGCANESEYIIDNDITHNGNKTMRITEKTDSKCWNGSAQLIKRKLDANKKYEISAYFYRNNDIAALNNGIRMYIQLGTSDKSMSSWLKLDTGTSFDGYSCDTGACIPISQKNLPDKQWTYFVGTGNSTIGSSLDNPYIWKFHFDYHADMSKGDSTIWISSPHFYEIEERKIKKGAKIGNLPIPSIDGYTFIGWYTAENGGKQVTSDTVIKDDINYYARFTKNNI